MSLRYPASTAWSRLAPSTFINALQVVDHGGQALTAASTALYFTKLINPNFVATPHTHQDR